MAYLNTDIPELRGYDTGLLLGNLDMLDMRLSRMLESTIASLSELADAILHDAAGDPETLESILLSLQKDETDSALLSDTSEEHTPTQAFSDALPQNAPLIRDMMCHMGLYERLILYRFIITRHKRSIPRADFHLSAAAKGRVAYMSNSFADKAYMCFSHTIPHCRAAAHTSFAEACEEVYGGLCEYCILPVENTFDGKLVGFYRLMIKYRLRIVAVCDVQNRALTGTSTTRFALLCHMSAAPPNDTPPHIELLHTTASPCLVTLLAAATFCGLRLSRIDTLPDMSGLLPAGDAPPVCVVLDSISAGTEADPVTFFYYLALESPDTQLMGAYRNITNT